MNESENVNEIENKKEKIFDFTNIITSVICLLPMVYGLVNWNKLPDQMAYHFGIDGQPDSFGPKWMDVILLPVVILIVHLFVILSINYKAKKMQKSKKNKMLFVTQWFCPFTSIIVNLICYLFNLGYKVPVSVIVQLFVGFLIVLIGNYIPKAEAWMFNVSVNEEVLPKYKRIFGFVYVIIGLIAMITAFLPFGLYILFAVTPVLMGTTVFFVIKVQK